MRRRRILPILAAFLLLAAAAAFLLLRPDHVPQASEPPPPPVEAPPSAPPAEHEAPSTPADLSAVLTLSPDCGLGDRLGAIFDRMVVIDPLTSQASPGAPIAVPGLPAPLAPTFRRSTEALDPGESRHVVAGVDLPGRWHGLRVTGLQLDFYEQSDVAGRQIRFAEPAGRVRDALMAAGFDLPPTGEFEEVEGEGMMPSIGVERIEEGAALTCTTG